MAQGASCKESEGRMIEYRVIWWERMAGIAEPLPFSGPVSYDWKCTSASLAHIRNQSHRVTKAFIEARAASDAQWPRFWDEEVVA
jgi:hypothetical protein